MSNQKSLKVTDETFTGFNQFKIKLAGSVGSIPTTADIVNAFLTLGDNHYDEIVGIIKGN